MLKDFAFKLKLGYIHFLRKPLFILWAKYSRLKQKNLKATYFLNKLSYHSDDFRLKILAGESPQSIQTDAIFVVNNKFVMLDSSHVYLGERINWQKDYKSKKVWSMDFYNKIVSKDSINGSDIKNPWELSRFHQTIWLGKAYLVYKEHVFANKIIDLIDDWIDNNPFCYGVNWNCTMEVAIRAVNWIISIETIRKSVFYTPQFEHKVLNSLYYHGLYIRNNLEYGRRNGNHYLSDLMGLIWIGALFSKYSFGRKWINFAAKELDIEIEKQIYNDGTDYEKSTYYQRLVFEILYNSDISLRLIGKSLSKQSINKLKAMFDFLIEYSGHSSNVNFGDNDNGRVTKFSPFEAVDNFGGAISVGAKLYNDSIIPGGLIKIKYGCDSVFLTYKSTKEFKFSGGIERRSTAYPEGGFYFLKNNYLSVYIDAGDIGMRGWGGHGHNDLLSFEIFLGDDKFITDSGTFCYTSSPEIRQSLRSTKAHNTIMIDNTEQAEFLNLFRIKEDKTKPQVIKWNTDKDKDILIAVNNSYQTLPDPVAHKRRFEFNKEKSSLLIEDEINGNKIHNVLYSIHISPDVSINTIDDFHFILNKNNKYLSVELKTENKDIKFKLGESIYSPQFGILQKNKKLCFEQEIALPIRFQTIIKLYSK